MEIVLHLGAHKTASTYIQRVLYHNAALLKQNGIGYVGPTEVRGNEDPGSGILGNLKRKVQGRGPARIARHVAAARKAQMRRLVISEENVIGDLKCLLLGDWCYRDVVARLEIVLQGLFEPPTTVMLAIRSYASFFPSAYAQALRATGFVPFDEVLRHRLAALDRGWTDLVRDVAHTVPASTRLVVWAYEDMEMLEHEIFCTLLGDGPACRLTPISERPMRGPSELAIRQLHAMARNSTPPSPDRVRQILRAHRRAEGSPGFDPWSPRERMQLEARYAADLDRIGAEFPGSLLRGTAMLRQSGVSM